LSIEIFMSCNGRAADELYKDLRRILSSRLTTSLLSLYQVKALIQLKSRMVPQGYDMCPNSCLAYAGKWSTYDCCPKCGTLRYDILRKKRKEFRKPKQRYYLLPFDAALQARWSTPEGARACKHRAIRTRELLEE
ncbi:hypothetical protein BT69DRAFT_1198915, partial [Atractiella rhizophila]